MNLINEEITHKVFGVGSIVEQDESVITIDFNDETKKFVYPDAFGEFIKLNDQNTAKSLKKVLAKKELEKAAFEKEQEEIKAQEALEQERLDMIKNLKIHESSQIVFWLDEEEQEQVFADWQVSTGTIQNGKNKGKPNKAARLRANSASVLTVREDQQPETERRIIGLYMVDETFSGDVSEDGIVPAHTIHKMKLTDEEAEQMLFWNYYLNKNFPDRQTWNTGKYRYFDNIWTAQILKDLIALRTDEEAKKEAEDFLEYFCEMNLLDIEQIPEAAGALKQ